MEDDKSTETSTNEEALDTEAELENDDTSFDDAEDTSDADETEESSESDEDESANESEDDEQEESAEDVDQEQTESKKDPEAERKEAARLAYEKREAARQARETAKREAQQKYIDEAEDSRDTALRQLQVDAYNQKIQRNTDALQNGIDKAVASIDLLRTGPPEVKAELADALDDYERMYVVRDRNGDPIEIRGDMSVTEFLQRKAESIRRLTGIREQRQQEARGKTKARTTTLPSRSPKEAKKDPDLEGFDEEANKY